MSKLYLFIDESGDPGYKKQGSGSFYQLNIMVCEGEKSIKKIISSINDLRFFLSIDDELKNYWGTRHLREKITTICKKIISSSDISVYFFRIDKHKYTGPYLGVDGTKFRNYILRKSLENIFSMDNYTTFESIELVIDRYLNNLEDQENLNNYLRTNYKLPRNHKNKSKFEYIQHIESLYCDSIQVIDILGRVHDLESLELVTCIDLSEIKKGLATPAGTQPSSSIKKL